MAKKTLRSVSKATIKPTANISVTIEEADNGFMVSSWMKDKVIKYVAKDKKEAMEYATKIFNKF